MYLCTATDVATRMSERGYSLRLDDNPQAVTQCLREATNLLYRHLLPVYTQSVLEQDAVSGGPDGTGGYTKDLATDIAVCKLAARRGNTVAATFKDVCKEAKETLLAMAENPDQNQLPNVPFAQPHYPAFSNVRLIQGYIYKQVRVEVTTSDLAPSGASYAQAIDFFSAMYIEY